MIIGIDLGTTNSLVSVWRDGRAELIPNSLGSFLTPSCVSLDEDGHMLVGEAARERLQTHPQRSASVFKRYMGSDKTLRLADKQFRAEELSAMVLRSLKADAEAFLGHAVDEAIITVPAYFSDAQRKATRNAGTLAGLKVERLLNEPTAAALAYGIHAGDADTRFLVFDLGGGTFDVSILELFEGVMEVRASAGDNFLGGEDVTKAIVDLFCERHQFSTELRNDSYLMQKLNAAAELAKRQISNGEAAQLEIFIDDQVYQTQLTEHDLEQLCAPLLQRLRAPVERALRDTNLRSSELDKIFLAGGATRMPLVKKLVTLMFGRFPTAEINPDEVVALGAAVQAGLKMKDSALDEIVMTDVAPYSLGVEVSSRTRSNQEMAGLFSPIIERNSIVPVSRVQRYYPQSEQQRVIRLEIYQGESRLVKDNIHLGSLEIAIESVKDIAENAIDVRFTYDVNGLLEVVTTHVQSQRQYSLIIEGNPGMLSESQIKQRFQELAAIKLHPRDTLEVRTMMARADRLYQQLRGEIRAWLGQQINEFVAIVDSQDAKKINPAKKRFAELLDSIESDNRVLTELHDD